MRDRVAESMERRRWREMIERSSIGAGRAFVEKFEGRCTGPTIGHVPHEGAERLGLDRTHCQNCHVVLVRVRGGDPSGRPCYPFDHWFAMPRAKATV